MVLAAICPAVMLPVVILPPSIVVVLAFMSAAASPAPNLVDGL